MWLGNFYDIFLLHEPTEPEFQATLRLQDIFLQSELLHLLFIIVHTDLI